MADIFATFGAVRETLHRMFNSQRGSGRTHILLSQATYGDFIICRPRTGYALTRARAATAHVIEVDPHISALREALLVMPKDRNRKVYFTEDWMEVYIKNELRASENRLTTAVESRNLSLPPAHDLFLGRFNLDKP